MSSEDVLAEYRRLRSVAEERSREVTRAEERLAAAEKAAAQALAQAKEAGFSSLDEMTARRDEIEAELVEAISKLKEAVA